MVYIQDKILVIILYTVIPKTLEKSKYTHTHTHTQTQNIY